MEREFKSYTHPVVRRQRIIYIIGQLAPGGSEQQLLLFLTHLDRNVIDPIIVVWRLNETHDLYGNYNALGIPLFGFPSDYGKFRKLKDFCILVRRLRADYIHSYSFFTNFAAWFAALLAGGKGVVGSIRSNFVMEVKESGSILGRLCALFPRRMIANNNAAAFNIQKTSSLFKPARVWVVPNGVDLVRFNPPSDRKPHSVVQIIGVGRLYSVKRWGWLIEVLHLLMKEKNLPEWKMTIHGSGPLLEELQDLIQKKGLAGRVVMEGYTADMAVHYWDSDIAVLCSSFEGSPNVLKEAVASGLPVISTDVGDAREVILDGETGYIIPTDDQQAFKDKLALLISSPEKRREMGEKGRLAIHKTRSVMNLIHETEKVYREMGWEVGLVDETV